MNIIFSTDTISKQLKEINQKTTTFSDLIRDLSEILPDSEIRIIELLKENKEEVPSKKALIIANSVNEILGGNKTIVTGTDPDSDFDEIGVSSICGSAFNHIIISFCKGTDKAELIIVDDYSFFTYIY